MKRWGPVQLGATLLFSGLVWVLLAAGCMMLGTRGAGWPPDESAFLERQQVVLLSSLVGAALAASGAAYQAILRNPLADPYLLGVSSGAALCAHVWKLPALTFTMSIGLTAYATSQQAFAFFGALVSVACVLLLANRRGRLEPVTLLLIGVIVNALNGSIFMLLYNLMNTMPSSEGALSMFVGGIQTALTLEQKRVATVIVAVGWLTLLALSGQLNVAGVSDDEAQSLGVRIHRLRWITLIVASLVTAAAVAISGPIGFIGLICPHLARLVVGSDQRRVIPLATALGAGLLALSDAASRQIAGAGLTLLPVGVLTSLLGGPFFLLLLLQSRRRVDVGEGR